VGVRARSKQRRVIIVVAPADGASQTQLFGTVSSIGIVAESSTSGSATFPVVIAVTGKQTGLYSGGSASVTIIVKQTRRTTTNGGTGTGGFGGGTGTGTGADAGNAGGTR
jgi:macrolide-specific efflux system membrane fusion protein